MPCPTRVCFAAGKESSANWRNREGLIDADLGGSEAVFVLEVMGFDRPDYLQGRR